MKDLGLLGQENQLCESLARKLFESYQPSKTATQKWHALDYICDALRDVGGKTFFLTGLFESGHNKFKSAH